jgi:hypothetical protein
MARVTRKLPLREQLADSFRRPYLPPDQEPPGPLEAGIAHAINNRRNTGVPVTPRQERPAPEPSTAELLRRAMAEELDNPEEPDPSPPALNSVALLRAALGHHTGTGAPQ